MAKSKSIYVCSACGFESGKWYGKCPECGEWNTMTEELQTASSKVSSARKSISAVQQVMKLKDITGDVEKEFQQASRNLTAFSAAELS